MSDDNINKADCFHCVHFTITWNPKTPKACKLFGFQSASLPSATVYKTTGTECMGFERKNTKK